MQGKWDKLYVCGLRVCDLRGSCSKMHDDKRKLRLVSIKDRGGSHTLDFSLINAIETVAILYEILFQKG